MLVERPGECRDEDRESNWEKECERPDDLNIMYTLQGSPSLRTYAVYFDCSINVAFSQSLLDVG